LERTALAGGFYAALVAKACYKSRLGAIRDRFYRGAQIARRGPAVLSMERLIHAVEVAV